MEKFLLVSKKQPELLEELRGCLERVVAKAVHGEFTVEDVLERIARGQAFGAFVKGEDGEVFIVCVWELVYYPQMTAVNVMCLGGAKTKSSWAAYGPILKKLWKEQGASVMECMTSPAMARLLRRAGVNVKPIYVLSRGDI